MDRLLMQTQQLRIVAGALRGRKIRCSVDRDLRPTPDRVREALFSILGNAVPNRIFYDIFAGTGVFGIEALSRGAKSAIFIERNFHLCREIEHHLGGFGLGRVGRTLKTDAYSWANLWKAPAEPVNLFVSPPFPDYENRPDAMLQLVSNLQERAFPDSVLTLQAERCDLLDRLPQREQWDERRYGRNYLLIWVKEEPTV
jgi:16S rRNA (guanine(966)-N(2))-methyltransferase RsmD